MEMWGPTVWSTLQPWSHGKCSSSDSSPKRETLSSSRFGLFKMQANQSCTPGRILWVCGVLLSQRGSHCFHEEDGSVFKHWHTPKVWAACRMCVMDFGAKTGLVVGLQQEQELNHILTMPNLGNVCMWCGEDYIS